MNSRMQDYVSPIETTAVNNHVAVREDCPNMIDPDFMIEHCNNGFCDRDMTLMFSNNKLYDPSLLSIQTNESSATTQAMLTTSLAYTAHTRVIYHITDVNLAKLYHVIDNPEVVFDTVSKKHVALRHHYIDRDTMTGVIINKKSDNGEHDVVGVFSPRGYGKIDAYNNFADKYLILSK